MMKKLKKLLKKLKFKKENNDKENENISDGKDSNSVNINHENCYEPDDKLWCKECVPRDIIEGWTSENHDIDEFIKDTIYNARYYNVNHNKYPLFLEWVAFDKFTDIKHIAKGGFSTVYTATWIDGNTKYVKQDDGSWKKLNSKPIEVALKILKMYNKDLDDLDELKVHWNLYNSNDKSLGFYGLTNDPKTKELVMMIQLANQGDLRSYLKNFNNILWKDKIKILYDSAVDIKSLHDLGYVHKDIHSGNILQNYDSKSKISYSYISDFGLSGLSGPSYKQKSGGKKYGVVPYMAPEVLRKNQYTLASDIYSIGIIMTELSSGNPPYNEVPHDQILIVEIITGLRPEFGKGTPEIYKKLACRCIDANPDQRPTADELYNVFDFWYYSQFDGYQEKEKFGYKGKEIKVMFEEANKEIPNIKVSFDKDSNARYTSSRAYSISNLIKTTRLWYKENVPNCLIEGWTSENYDIDRFIKNTICNARYYFVEGDKYPLFLEWVPFDKFKDIEPVGKGGFAEVFSATWIDGNAKYTEQDNGSWKILDSKPMKVALKRLNGSQNMSAEYLNELETHWNLYSLNDKSLRFYGLTKDPNTKEFIMVMQFANQGSLCHILSNNFKNILWKDKIKILHDLTVDLKNLHEMKYFYKDFHSGNILQDYNPDLKVNYTYISDFGLSGPSYKQKSDDKVYGVMSYMAPEVLDRKQYTSASDIYSLGIIMTELSSGMPPFHNKKHDVKLSLDICNGLKPGFGKGTPEIYKELAHKCMNTDPNKRITARELFEIFDFWCNSIDGTQQENESFGYKGKEVKVAFEEADKEIPNISTSYEKNPGATYTSKALPINLSLNDEENDKDHQDSKLCDLEI